MTIIKSSTLNSFLLNYFTDSENSFPGLNLITFFAGIIIFGLLRAFAYKNYEWNAAAGQNQLTLLFVKHIILAVVFVLGLLCYIRAAKFVRKACDEKTE